MIKKLTAVCAVMALLSCNDGGHDMEQHEKTADSTVVASFDGNQCFQKVSGRDTTTLNLVIEGNNVTGKMKESIWEKDAKNGLVSGTIDKNVIRAMFYYMQEGTNDSLRVEFQISDRMLMQKPVAYSSADGRPYTDSTKGFAVHFDKVDCAE